MTAPLLPNETTGPAWTAVVGAADIGIASTLPALPGAVAAFALVADDGVAIGDPMMPPCWSAATSTVPVALGLVSMPSPTVNVNVRLPTVGVAAVSA